MAAPADLMARSRVNPEGVIALEGDLSAELRSGYAVLYLDGAQLAELVAYCWDVRAEGESGKRDFGRVRLSVTPMRE